MPVILKTAGKQVAHKLDDLVIIILHIPLLNGGIVLIDNNNRRSTIMFVDHGGQIQQRRSQLYLTDFAIRQLCINFLTIRITLVTAPKLLMALGFPGKNIPDSRKRFLPGVKLYIFKGQKNYRIFALIITIFLTACRLPI